MQAYGEGSMSAIMFVYQVGEASVAIDFVVST